MKNVKNIFLATLAIIGLLSAQSALALLSYNEKMFVEETKKKKDLFEMGNVRNEWLARAVNVILGGSKVTERNKDIVLSHLTEMIDIILGAPLRSNPNLTDAQYAKIMFDVDSKVRIFVFMLFNNNQQSSMPSVQTPVVTITFQSILNGALGEPYTSKANRVYNSNIPAYVDGLTREINAAINASYPNESTRIQAIQRAIDKYYVYLGRSGM